MSELRWYKIVVRARKIWEKEKPRAMDNDSYMYTALLVVCFTAFLCVVTQRSTPALRDGDDTKNSCEEDYIVNGSAHFHHGRS